MRRLLPSTGVEVLDGKQLGRAWRAALESAEFVETETITAATAGAATLPANPVGFLKIKVNGTAVLVPYYDVV